MTSRKQKGKAFERCSRWNSINLQECAARINWSVWLALIGRWILYIVGAIIALVLILGLGFVVFMLAYMGFISAFSLTLIIVIKMFSLYPFATIGFLFLSWFIFKIWRVFHLAAVHRNQCSCSIFLLPEHSRFCSRYSIFN